MEVVVDATRKKKCRVNHANKSFNRNPSKAKNYFTVQIAYMSMI